MARYLCVKGVAVSPVILIVNWKIELYDNMAGYQVVIVIDCRAVSDDAIVMALVVIAVAAVVLIVVAVLSTIAEHHLLRDVNLKELDLQRFKRLV